MVDLPLGYQPSFIVVNTDDAPLDQYDNMPGMEAAWLADFIDYTLNGSTNMPLCLPGRAAGFSGLRVEHHRGFGNSDGSNVDLDNTFIEALHRAGYLTAAVGKWLNGFGEGGDAGFGTQERQPGVDFQRIYWGAPRYYDYDVVDENGDLTHYGSAEADYATDVQGQHCIDFLNSIPSNRPFCLYWAPRAPHAGFTPANRHLSSNVSVTKGASWGLLPSKYGNAAWLDDAADDWGDADAVAQLITDHTNGNRAVLSVDEWLVDIMGHIQASGRINDTIVILKTDNAHAFGELRQSDKGIPHKAASSMLLMVRVPGISGGTRRHAVSDIDVAPTICRLAGASMRRASDGMSFHKTFSSATAPHRRCALNASPSKPPTFGALWYEDGRVYYEGWELGQASGAIGCWTEADQIRDQGPQPDAAAELAALQAYSYPAAPDEDGH